MTDERLAELYRRALKGDGDAECEIRREYPLLATAAFGPEDANEMSYEIKQYGG